MDLRWLLGVLLLVGAAAAAGVMSLKSMGVLGESLPGCGAESACDAVTNSVFGSIPGLGWPVAFVGLAFFCGLLMAWTSCHDGVSTAIRAVVRVGALGSFAFIVIMIMKGAMCPYCITTHVCNLAFWGLVETMPTRTSSTALVQWCVTAVLATVVIGVGDAHRVSIHAPVHKAARQANEEAIVAASTGDDTATTTPFTGRYLRGPQDAAIQIVMFSDYQCPDCRRKEQEIAAIMDGRPDVSLTIKHHPFNSDCNPHFPRKQHANACWAARAAETAGILGGEDAFWTWHDWLFLNEGKFSDGRLPSLVEELGMDRAEFTEVMTSDYVNDLILEDVEEAQRLGLFYTPMIFINGVQLKWALPGTPPLRTMVARIANRIGEGDESAAPRTPDTKAQKFIADWRDAGRRPLRKGTQPFTISYGTPSPGTDPVEIMIYGDYLSDQMSAMIREIEASGVAVQGTMRVFPLDHDCNELLSKRNPGAPGSCLAAKAVKAAGVVGGDAAFQRMHDWALANQPTLANMDEAAWAAVAAEQGLELAEYLDTLTGPGMQALIQEDAEEYAKLRVRGVPSLFVQGKHIPRPFLEGHSIITSVLQEAAKAPNP